MKNAMTAGVYSSLKCLGRESPSYSQETSYGLVLIRTVALCRMPTSSFKGIQKLRGQNTTR